MITWPNIKRLSADYLRSFLRRSSADGWLSDEVSEIVRAKRKEIGPQLAVRRLRSISSPGASAGGFALVLSIVFVLLSLVLSRWNPRVIGVSFRSVPNDYLTLWQVQIAMAAVALPVLLFAIGLSKDERQAAMRTHEVLIRDTWVFPIMLFSFLGAFKIGVDLVWFRQSGVFSADLLLVFGVTLFLTVFAYWRALGLFFSPARLRKRSLEVAKEKMEASIDASVQIRLGNNLLLEKLREMHVDFWPFSSTRRESEHYAFLRAPRTGTLMDVHLGRLRYFVDHLPYKYPYRAFPLTDLDLGLIQPEPPPEESVWLLKTYRQPVVERYDELVRLKRASFDDLDIPELESRLRGIFKIGETDENQPR